MENRQFKVRVIDVKDSLKVLKNAGRKLKNSKKQIAIFAAGEAVVLTQCSPNEMFYGTAIYIGAAALTNALGTLVLNKTKK